MASSQRIHYYNELENSALFDLLVKCETDQFSVDMLMYWLFFHCIILILHTLDHMILYNLLWGFVKVSQLIKNLRIHRLDECEHFLISPQELQLPAL